MEPDDLVSGPSRDYLAEPRMATRANVLVQHLQAQPYIHRVRAGHSALEDVEDDDDNNDEDEQSSDLSITSWDSEEEERRARQEWEDNIQQLNLALQVMLLPFFGKWLGRKWSYWGEYSWALPPSSWY